MCSAKDKAHVVLVARARFVIYDASKVVPLAMLKQVAM